MDASPCEQTAVALPPRRSLPPWVRPALSPLLRALPSLVTLLGLLVGLLGLAALPSRAGLLLLALSLVCDAVDGALARALGVASRWGAELDWHVDTLLGALGVGVLAARVHPAWFLVAGALVLVQATARCHAIRVSGRAGVFVLVGLALARESA